MLNKKKFSTKRTSKRSAFTLIELSIVLIIIGLLVAGITGGASLIKSAQLRSVMSEARGYNVAVNSFVVQYDELPGDYNVVFTYNALATPPGDRNGRIEWINGNTNTSNYAGVDVAEGISAWIQLLATSTIDKVLTYSSATVYDVAAGTFTPGAAGTAYPDSKLDGVGWVFDYTNSRNVLVLTGNIGATTHVANTAQTLTAVAGITPTDALSIDSKLDDSVANTGRVRGSGTTTCYDAAAYTTSNTGKTCAMEFTVDIS